MLKVDLERAKKKTPTFDDYNKIISDNGYRPSVQQACPEKDIFERLADSPSE
jgi:hypothetical protein